MDKIILIILFVILLQSCNNNSTNPDPNTPPQASFTFSPDTGDVFTIFTFDATSCTDAEDDSDSLQVRWDFEDDGVWDTPFSTNKIVTHQFSTEGSYSVKMEVKDSKGAKAQATKKLGIAPFIKMVFVEGGSFEMGDLSGTGFTDEVPVHKVTVSSFYIGKYEITRAEWNKIMENSPKQIHRVFSGQNFPTASPT
ncbi:MAG: hypothetical protein Kow00108_20390 [Calditrichia bacterium]